jgi:GDP-mannose 6-dehydrogenase
MKIAVFGMGYIGCVTAACLSKWHQVVGVDINKDKIRKLRWGKAPIKEKGLNELLSSAIKNKKLNVTTDTEKAVLDSDLGFVCVGTPSNPDGSIDLSTIRKACFSIAKVLSNKKKRNYIIVIRSSVIPGTIEKLGKEIKTKYGFISNKDFYFADNPEFLREGSAVKDFMNPPSIVVGSVNYSIAKKVASLYNKIDATTFITPIKIAEMIKYVNNSFHALKVSFTNEIATICKELNVNSRDLMKIFCNDKILNVSEYYFKPGFAYGGSCLPKDLAALNYKAKEIGIETPILRSISRSNKQHIRKAFKLIEKEARKSSTKDISIFGLAFKSGTDDIRGSPTTYLIDKLLEKKYQLKLYDPIIKKEQIENILSSYREVIYDPVSETKNLKRILPKISNLIIPYREFLNSKIIVVINKGPELIRLLKNLREDQTLVDLKGMINPKTIKAKYVKLC